jgi:hypothetical protein
VTGSVPADDESDVVDALVVDGVLEAVAATGPEL